MSALIDESLVLRARYDEEPTHSDHVARLALLLFDGLQSWHNYDARARELLHSAALLHDIGWSQTPDGKGHHKWSARLIKDHAWQNLKPGEISLVAQIARYHRKTMPKAEHIDFRSLSTFEQKQVMVLGGILRIADALDRTHTAKVQGLQVVLTKEDLVVRVRATGTWNAERTMFEIKQDMLQTAIGRPIHCEPLK